MDEKKAKQLIKKLSDAAFIAGQYSANPKSIMFLSESEKAISLGNEVVRHLTSRSSRAAYDCEKFGHLYYWRDDACIYCGALKPPPA